MFRFTLEKQISLAFLVAFSILLTIGIFSYRSVSKMTESLKQQKQSKQILRGLDELLILILNLEGGPGYILTANKSFLIPYFESKDKINGQLEKLNTLLADNPQQVEKIAQLNTLVNQKLKFTQDSNELSLQNDDVAAVELIRTESELELMSKIRLIIKEIKQEESSILDKKEEALDNNIQNSYWMLLLGSVGGVMSIGLANFAIFRETSKRSKAEKELKAINKNLETSITKRTKQLSAVNQELKKKSDFVQVTLDSLAANIAVVNKLGEIIIVNERWNTFAEENKEIGVGIGENYLEVYRKSADQDEISKEILENLQNILDGNQQTFRIEYARPRPAHKRWFILQINALQNEEGSAVISYFDISERKKIEIELRESEEFNRSIVENNPDCIKVLDMEGYLLSMNANGLTLMETEDFSPFVGKNWIDFWEGEDRQKAIEILENAKLGKSGKLDGYRPTVKNNIKYWETSINPLFGEDGKPFRLIVTSRDATKRQEAQQERERLLESETAARHEAEVANQMRDEFLATLSHELRAPLNSILGWGQMLTKGGLNEEIQQKAIETIVRNAKSQNKMIEDLLDVSRIISGKVRLEITKVKLTDVIKEALESVRPAATAKHISLEFIEDSTIGQVSGDANRLQQVIWNLLSNGIKFTPSGGKITIETKRIDSEIEVTVTDTGIGIKEEFLPDAFKRFRQADSSSIRKFGGLGLGLAIVRHITEMHGGTVSVHSEGENKGSAFTITLPTVISRQNSEDDKEIEKLLTAEETSFNNNLRLDGLLILVVDDEIDSRQMLVQALTMFGATVITGSSAKEGLQEIEGKNPDILVSDIGMPEEDGYSLIRKVRDLPNEKSNIPAIALTAFSRQQDRERALNAGFQNHVAKPVQFTKLVSIIKELTDKN